MSGRCETVSSVNIESRGPNRPIRTGSASTGAGFRNRLPAFPVSGVKRPAPVAVGIEGCVVFVVSCSSGEVRLIGGGREGNSSSISGTDPKLHKPSKASQIMGLSPSARRRLLRASSGRLPFRAVIPERQWSIASSGKVRAARCSCDSDGTSAAFFRISSNASRACLCLPRVEQHLDFISKQPLHRWS
jgi:hypothetical protein